MDEKDLEITSEFDYCSACICSQRRMGRKHGRMFINSQWIIDNGDFDDEKELIEQKILVAEYVMNNGFTKN